MYSHVRNSVKKSRQHRRGALKLSLKSQKVKMSMYNMNGFGIEIIYDYYIAMKFMFLVAKLFSQPFIIYASFTIQN